MENLIETGFWKYALMFFIVAIVTFTTALLVLTRNNNYSKSLARLLFSATAMILAYDLYVCIQNREISTFFCSVYFIFMDLICYYLYKFTIQLTRINMDKKVHKVANKLIILMVFLDTAQMFVNAFTEHAAKYNITDINSHIIYKFEQYFWFDMHLVLCYFLVAISLITLIRKLVKVQARYRASYVLVLITMLLIVLSNVIFLFGNSKVVFVDISIIFYAIGGIVIWIQLYYIAPAIFKSSTNGFIVNNLDMAVILFDDEEKILHCNLNAKNTFPLISEHENSGIPYDVKTFERDYKIDIEGPPHSFEWKNYSDGKNNNYSGTSSVIVDKNGRDIIGRLVLVQNMTNVKDPITGLESESSLFHQFNLIVKKTFKEGFILCFNINGLKSINESLSHESGNRAMKKLMSSINIIIEKKEFAARTEDGTIVIIFLDRDIETIRAYAEEVKFLFQEDQSLGFSLEVEYGISSLLSSAPYRCYQEAISSMKNKKMLSKHGRDSSLINSFSHVLAERNLDTEEHVKRTCEVAAKIAPFYGLSEIEKSELMLLCMLHDIGKISIPDDILLKPGSLTPDEWAVMKSHCEIGYRIAMSSAELKPIAELILHHHEKYDGTGYPSQLAGEDIPLLSRIVNVVDSFDAMTNDRPYKKAMSIENAKNELIRCSGTQFDPEIVNIFLKVLDDER